MGGSRLRASLLVGTLVAAGFFGVGTGAPAAASVLTPGGEYALQVPSDGARAGDAGPAPVRARGDHAPSTPMNPQFLTPSRPCSTNSGAPVSLNGNQPVVVGVNQTDPDAGQNVSDTFSVQDLTAKAAPFEYDSAFQAQGGLITVTIPTGTLNEGHLYGWSARGTDGTLESVKNSSTCYFTVDDTAPAAPAVTTTATSFVVGEPIPVTVSLAPSSDVIGVGYWIAYGGVTSSSAPVLAAWPGCGSEQGGVTFVCPSGDTVSLTVAPIDDYSTLWVASYDAAGNTSPATPLALENADGGPASEPADATYHWWLPQSSGSPLPSVLPDQNTTVETDLTLGDGLPLDATDAIGYQTDVPVLSFPGTISSATRAHTDSAAVDTTQSFTASAWVKPADSSGTMAVLAQSGASDSGFVLEDVAGHMTFCVKSQIGSGAADCATYGIASPANSWVMVTGIWDAGNHQVRIVVGSDMSAVAFASHVPPSGDVTAGGVVTVGSAQAGGVSVSAWNGEIASALVIQEAGDSYLLNYLGGLFS